MHDGQSTVTGRLGFVGRPHARWARRLMACLRALRPHQAPTRCGQAGRLLGILIRV